MEGKLDIINPEDKDYYDGKLYMVGIYPGAGMQLATFYVYASYEEEALELVVAYLDMQPSESNLIFTTDEIEDYISESFEDEFKEYMEENPDADTFQFATDYLGYYYVDATMQGASQPYFVEGNNLRVEETNDEPIVFEGKKVESKKDIDTDFVNYAYDLIADYLYHEANTDNVSVSEIKDYIYNDVCDDELHDYCPNDATIKAILDKLKNSGYGVLEESKESDKQDKKEENKTEDYWDATEIDRDLFLSLMKFNFGTDSKGNNYIITADGNDIKRFYAENNAEALRVYNDVKAKWKYDDHPDLTMNIGSIAPREESKKEEDCTQAGAIQGPTTVFGSEDEKEKKEEYYSLSDDEHIIWDSEIDLYNENTMDEVRNNDYQDYLDNAKANNEEPVDFEEYYENLIANGFFDNYMDSNLDDLTENILPEIEKQLNNDLLLLSGDYGSNYPDFRPSGEGGVLWEHGVDEFKSYTSEFDRVCITTKNGILGTICADHDGTVSGQFYTLPDDITELLKALDYESVIKDRYTEEELDKYNEQDLMESEFENDIYYGGIDARDLTTHIDLLKPIKDTISGHTPNDPTKKTENLDKRIYMVMGNYGQGWETVYSSEDKADAEARLKEYNENEKEYPHKMMSKGANLFDSKSHKETESKDIKTENNKIPRNWKKITYKSKTDTNVDKVGDTIEVERDEWNRPIATNLRTGKTALVFLDMIRNEELSEIVNIETTDKTESNKVTESIQSTADLFAKSKEALKSGKDLENIKVELEQAIKKAQYEEDNSSVQLLTSVLETVKERLPEKDIERESKEDLLNNNSKLNESKMADIDAMVNDFETMVSNMNAEVNDELINEYFTDVFYDIEDEEDMDIANEAERTIREKYNIKTECKTENYKIENKSVKTESDESSKYKQRFIDYCKDKVKDLGQVTNMSEEDIESNSLADNLNICLIEPEFRGDKDVRVLSDDDGGCICVNQSGEIIFNGGAMWSIDAQAMDYTFTAIDTEFYNNLLEYWDELYLDDVMELDDVDKESREKIQRELKLPEHFSYNINSRAGGADVEVYNDTYRDLKATTTTMKDGEHVQEYFDIDGLWEVNTLNEDGKYKDKVYANGWQEAVKILQDEYNKLQATVNESKKVESEDEVKDYGEYYVKEFDEDGTDINTVGFASEQEAVDYAEENIKKHPECEYAVYVTKTDECLYQYDKSYFRESKSLGKFTESEDKDFKVGDKVKVEYTSDASKYNGEVGTLTMVRKYKYYPDGNQDEFEYKTQGIVKYDDGTEMTISDLNRKGSGIVSPVEKVSESKDDTEQEMYLVEYYPSEKDAKIVSKSLEKQGRKIKIEQCDDKYALYSTYSTVTEVCHREENKHIVKEDLDESNIVNDTDKLFMLEFQLSKLSLFEVRYSRVGSNKYPDFATSGCHFIQNKKDFDYCGQCQDKLLQSYPEAKAFYEKWDAKHLSTLTPEEYDDLMKDVQVLKDKYNYIEKLGEDTKWDFSFYTEVELSKQPIK